MDSARVRPMNTCNWLFLLLTSILSGEASTRHKHSSAPVGVGQWDSSAAYWQCANDVTIDMSKNKKTAPDIATNDNRLETSYYWKCDILRRHGTFGTMLCNSKIIGDVQPTSLTSPKLVVVFIPICGKPVYKSPNVYYLLGILFSRFQ